ncbi:MAG: DUF4142 domain-containing protein [Alphaproteobacteria bacterium]|nr:DUF4142 domain-containing protein [Alphaproteobacteria bacterium]MBV9693926.1 DUF4142 domain-containing protein [Alphaproteobacteria bacterium]
MTAKLLLLAASVAVLAALPASAEPPRPFLLKAIQGDNAEIRLGKLAQRKAENRQVRDFGATLIDDHRMARDQASQVAQRLGIDPPSGVAPEAKREYSKLEGMSGPRFDREFVSYMIGDHQKDIAEFKREARSDNGPVGRLAQKQLPTLEKHLHIAENLADQRISRR